ncbi:MAG: glyoxalase [Lachnospiraceae bacterium]|nr:glyoxalase [Lachnospiraceae bacterium]
MELDELAVEYFFNNQTQLFSKPVAETIDEAADFLEDCMAVTFDSADEVREYMDEMGMDISGMSDDELLEQSEIFCLPDGRYLYVEG